MKKMIWTLLLCGALLLCSSCSKGKTGLGEPKDSHPASVDSAVSRDTVESVAQPDEKLQAPEPLSETALQEIAADLKVPAELDDTITQSQPYFYEAGQVWLIQVDITVEDTLVAAAAVDGFTGELCRDIFMFSEENLPKQPAFVPEWDVTGEENIPYLIAVNRTTQTVTVYEKDEAGNYTVPMDSMICSTGTYTPLGKYHTTDKYVWCWLEGNVYGQYATRIVDAILFHSVPYFTQNKNDLESEEFNQLGTDASLGCVRLQVEDCKWIYDSCPSGTPVVFFDGDASMDPLGNPGFTPIDVSHPNAGWDPTDPDPANPWHADS